MSVFVICMVLVVPSRPPALRDFAQAWSKVHSYSAVLVMHERSGATVQDRTYNYTFVKPSTATIVITRGPGKGGRETWTGGDSVVASPPGLLSRLRLRLSIKDPRVVTLRGDTIAMASFGWLLQHLQSKGRLSQAPGPSIGAHDTTQISLTVEDPASNGGITRDVVDISVATKFPVRVLRFAGSTLAKQIDFNEVTFSR